MISSQIDPPDSHIDLPDSRRLSADDAGFLSRVHKILYLKGGHLRDTCRTKRCNNELERKHRYCPACIAAREMAQDREYKRDRALVMSKGGGG